VHIQIDFTEPPVDTFESFAVQRESFLVPERCFVQMVEERRDDVSSSCHITTFPNNDGSRSEPLPSPFVSFSSPQMFVPMAIITSFDDNT
jgi:hypothetical protein